MTSSAHPLLSWHCSHYGRIVHCSCNLPECATTYKLPGLACLHLLTAAIAPIMRQAQHTGCGMAHNYMHRNTEPCSHGLTWL